MALDWQLLAGLPPDELQVALLAELDMVMRGQSAFEEDRLLTVLPEPLRAIWLLSWLDFEVAQGSLLAYFFNSHGRHALLAADVLRRMGAYRMADVVARAAASYQRVSAARTARRADVDAEGEFALVTAYGGLPDAGELSRLTDQYRQAADDDDWGDKLSAYLSGQVRLLAE